MILSCPLSVWIGPKDEFTINLNQYRNAHYQTLNKAKIEFKRVMFPQVRLLPVMEKIKVHFTLYRKDNRLCDTSNICSIVEKFLLDAIVESGKLKDDNYKYHVFSSCEFGGIDKVNPRVEAHIVLA